MIDHHLQKDILKKLVECESASFSELKPSDVEGNIFTYHLQQLVKQKVISKLDDGNYTLTAKGKALGINSALTGDEVLQQAHSVLFMVLEDPEKGWLLRRRLAQPVYGKLGFVHGEPIFTESVEITASQIFKTKTNLDAEFKVHGSGYVRMTRGEALESFTHFTLLHAHSYEGELVEKLGKGENVWLKESELSDVDLIPSVVPLIEQINANGQFFLDLDYDLQ